MTNEADRERAYRWGLLALLFVAFLGFADASYLTANAARGATATCTVVEGCDVVLASVYSRVGGLPLSAVGVFYYLMVALLAWATLRHAVAYGVFALVALTAVGFGVSLYLVYLQFFILKSICLYCMFSAATSAALFVIACSLAWSAHKKQSSAVA